MTWNLYEKGEFLKPLMFSNGKSQEDIVKEVLQAVRGGENVIFIHGQCGTGKCLEKNSLIFCKPEGEKSFGYHKISEIVGKKGKIISKDKFGNLVKSKFMNIRKTGVKKLYKLKTRTGREIILSKNHPLFTITENGTEWKPLEELNENSYICLPNKINLCLNTDYDENKIKILAHLIAEGKLGDKAGSPRYYQCPKQNPLIREDYIVSLKSVFPDGIIKERDKEVNIIFKLMNTTKGTTNKLRLLIREHGLDGKKSNEKFVPEIIFGLKKEKIAIFLSRLFSCDGCIYSKKKQIVIEYSSISRKLIQDISILLNIFGIQHTIASKKFRENKEYSWRICISNQESLRKYIEEIGFIGRKQKDALNILKTLKKHKFTNIDKVPGILRDYLKNKGCSFAELDRLLNYEKIQKERKNKNFRKIIEDKLIKTPSVLKQTKIDFLRSHIRKINERIRDKELSIICNEDVFWDKIKSIDFLKKDETYDLEVPKLNNFIANGIIVHNSAIALNIANELGKTSIVVPGKNLQQQYKKDYEQEKYLLKKDSKSPNEKLKISVMTGRKNHKCKYLEDSKDSIPKFTKEVNSKLQDIFEGKKEEVKETISKDISADNPNIPCKIEIKEKNSQRIRYYLKQNKRIKIKNFEKISDVKRMSIAPVCPYWSPVIPEEYEVGLEHESKHVYKGLDNKNFVYYKRKPGCKFYEQFMSYIDADVIVFNSLKYLLESALSRKPATNLEIIDECDEFLDSFSNQRTINLERLQNVLGNIIVSEEDSFDTISEVMEIIKHIKRDPRVGNAVQTEEIIPLKETGIFDLFRIFLSKSEFLNEVDEESYVFDVERSALMFSDFLDESYVTFSKKDDAIIASVVTTNLAKKFKELINKNKIIVLMSGTIHSEEVLRDIFGLDNFKIIEAETVQPGEVIIKRTGQEFDCKYSNFTNGKADREKYLKALDKCVEIAEKPILVHVNSFIDLPNDSEIQKFNLKNLMTRDKMREMQNEDKKGILINDFKDGKIKTFFSTRCSRGVDFPGEQCKSIIFTKYPNPNVQDAFWRILNKTQPQYYWEFYRDKAKRELLQKLYRGLRFKEDRVYLLSPDSRVLEAFEESGKKN